MLGLPRTAQSARPAASRSCGPLPLGRERAPRPLEAEADPVPDLEPVHGQVLRGLDAELHLTASNFEHRDRDVVADHDLLTELPSEHEMRHATSLVLWTADLDRSRPSRRPH